MTATTVISIIAALGLGTPITVLLTGILNRKKNKTDGASVVQGMAIGVAQEIREQLRDVRKELDLAQSKITALEAKVDAAEARAEKAERDRDKLTSAWPQGTPIPVL